MNEAMNVGNEVPEILPQIKEDIYFVKEKPYSIMSCHQWKKNH